MKNSPDFNEKEFPDIDYWNHRVMATINNVDILVSWNFKHIVNVLRIRGYNAVNLMHGYKSIDIRSPKEIIHYEKE